MLPGQYRQKETNYFCRFTFGQFFTLLVIEIFTLFGIFYLGARYGRTLLGISEPAQIAQQEGSPGLTTTDPNVIAATQDPEIKALAKDLLESSPSPDLKERVAEMLKEKIEERQPAAAGGTAGEVKAPKVVTIPAPQEPEFQEQARAEEMSEPQAAAEAPSKPAPVIQTNPTPARYSIQVGSYTNVDEAHAMVGSWKTRGYQAFLVSADIPGKGRWYRVRLGGFNTKEEAQSYLNELTLREQQVDAFIAPNE